MSEIRLIPIVGEEGDERAMNVCGERTAHRDPLTAHQSPLTGRHFSDIPIHRAGESSATYW
ncbi:hypothetical protein [Streptomyces sp. NPDC052042]|uniref:hypothetical protein n=1 Tax=Streptomyces sp. NPDC052042 TaxID=3365683 RepID=UPI0037D87B13